MSGIWDDPKSPQFQKMCKFKNSGLFLISRQMSLTLLLSNQSKRRIEQSGFLSLSLQLYSLLIPPYSLKLAFFKRKLTFFDVSNPNVTSHLTPKRIHAFV